ncbi:hypothetical protein NZK35_03590 [Stieleria sp. ICT_E10.1]|uniref:hypothetical protein n=1 Tax=Stieleria sedimenti TaxID=2976331 RepID=UPI00217F3735|nr:hypothetical protein [Stieleria sedimenti]MCS7465757.1 hypothetical protein [Stieleria sedimenti]
MTQPEHDNEDSSSVAPTRRSPVAGVGLVLAICGLVAAVLSPWILDAIEPERKPMDEVAVEFATKVKDRLIAKAKKQEYVPPVDADEGFDVAKWYPAGTIALGLCGICCGVGGFCKHEDLRIAGSSVAVGLSAIFFQYFLLLAATILFILLVGIVLSAMGIDLPTP